MSETMLTHHVDGQDCQKEKKLKQQSQLRSHEFSGSRHFIPLPRGHDWLVKVG